MTTETDQNQNSGEGGGGDAAAAAAAAAATAAAAAAGGGGGEGGGEKAYYEAFTDETLKTSPAIHRYKTPEELARGFVNLEKRIGVPADRLMQVPSDPKDAAAYTEILRKLGAPETAADYGLTLPDEAPEHLKAISGQLAEAFHKAGLVKGLQTQPLIDMLTAQAAAADAADAAAAEKAAADCKAALKTEWGAKHDTYHKEIDKLVFEAVGAEGVAELNAAGFGNNVTLMRMLAKFADMRAEPGKAPGGDGQVKVDRAMTPAEAKGARLLLESDPLKGMKGALGDAAHPLHAAVIEERLKLLQMENPQPAGM